MAGHVVLIGDSIFDNAAYVPGGPSVLEHLRGMLPTGWRATLVAVDGATVSATFEQLGKIPRGATHLVLSVGGNDAIGAASSLLSQDTVDVDDALRQLGAVRREFFDAYTRLVSEIRTFGLPLVICTVYDSVPGLSASESAGLCLFNDTITRVAFEAQATLIDLRSICSEHADYSPISPIEPSASGGAKIAQAIVEAVLGSGGCGTVIA